jgi:quercetin dioxygenase-like cupin family protein
MSHFGRWQDLPVVEVSSGDFVSAVTGENLQIVRARMQPGLTFPLHSHDAEQYLLVLEGALHFTVGDETVTAEPGGLIHVPSGVPHGGSTHETLGALTIEIFSPPRQDFTTPQPDRLTYT